MEHTFILGKMAEEIRRPLTLMVTALQRETIFSMFHHHDWDIEEVTETSDSTLQGTSSSSGAVEEDTGDAFVINHRDNAEECPHCLCRPCITDSGNKQMWWEDVNQPESVENSSRRKQHYRRFWTMLLHRGVWRDFRYKARKSQALETQQANRRFVWSGTRHKRDIMPDCVITLVRTWLPNPDRKSVV